MGWLISTKHCSSECYAKRALDESRCFVKHSGCGACLKKGLAYPSWLPEAFHRQGSHTVTNKEPHLNMRFKISRSCAFSGLVVMALALRLGYLAVVWTEPLGNAHSEAYKTLAISLSNDA
jgi:hypothetical protein